MKLKGCNLRITSQLPICSYPLSMDLYSGCPHGCKYCFARLNSKFNSSTDQDYELSQARDYKPLLRHIKEPLNKDNLVSVAIKQKQPVHIGGMSDPFPIGVEEKRKHTKSFLKAIGGYPCIWSTKNPIEEYADLFAKGNHILQVSIIGFGEVFERIETNCPTSEERLKMMKAYKGKAKKIIVRMQPLIPWLYDEDKMEEYMKNISEVADGVVVEFLKMKYNEKFEDLEKVIGLDIKKAFADGGESEGNDWVIPYGHRKIYIEMARKYAKKYGLEFFVGENAFRHYGDSPMCCGVTEKDADCFKSKLRYNSSEFIFEIMKRKVIYQDELIKRIPKEFEVKLSSLIWNFGNRKGYYENKNKTLSSEAEGWIKSKNGNNPAILFKDVSINRDLDSGRIYFKYEGEM